MPVLRITSRAGLIVPAAAALLLLPGLTQAADPTDTKPTFGFNAPVAKSATGTFDGPGDKAITVAEGLTVTEVTDKAAMFADQLTLYPNDQSPTDVFWCNEAETEDYPDGTAFPVVQRMNIASGEITDVITGNYEDCDATRATPWGTIIFSQEVEDSGNLVEILDPLNTSGVTVDQEKRTSSDDAHVVFRPGLGQLAWEGIAILPDGTTYYGEDRRPGAGVAGGGIYKFVPATPFSGTAAITDAAASPYADGSVYNLRIGTHSGDSDWGPGRNIGAGVWIPVANDPGASDGDFDLAALTANTRTGFYRTEDMDIDPIAAAAGSFRACFPNTGSDTDQNYGEVVCLTDAKADDATAWPTGTKPVTTQFVVGNPDLRMPDNIDFQPGTGIMYLNMDATTSVENDMYTNDDIWACLPDGDDSDLMSDGCVRVATLNDGNAEFTGIQFMPDGRSFIVSLQHRGQDGRTTPNTTDIVQVSGFSMP
jgi:secreted PhoX family phosphatase